MNRRSMLKKGAVGTFIGLAGCYALGSSSDDESNGDGSQDNSENSGDQSTDSGNGSGEKANSGPEKEISGNDDVEVVEATYDFGMFSGPTISGEVKNLTNSDITSVTIKVHYFDTGETRIGESMDMINDLAAGGSATFETVGGFDVEKGDIARWELTVESVDF